MGSSIFDRVGCQLLQQFPVGAHEQKKAWTRTASARCSQIQKRLDMSCAELDCIDDRAASRDKGKVAARIFGFEVQLAELFEYGFFRSLDATQVLLVLAAVVFVPRRGDPVDVRRVPRLGRRKDEAEQILDRFFNIERMFKVFEDTRRLQWGLSQPVQVWAEGGSLDDLARVSEIASGDIIRYFRLTLQMVRQFRKALQGLKTPELLETLDLAAALLNRDEVDAEQQLLAG